MHRCGHVWAHGHFLSYGQDWWPGTLLSTLSTMLWIALFLGLAWALLRWLSPYILPMIADIFGMGRAEPSALEILRRRYAAGEIDAGKEALRPRIREDFRFELRVGHRAGVATDGTRGEGRFNAERHLVFE